MTRIMGQPHELKVVNVRLVKEPSLYSEYPIRTPQDVMKVVAEELSQYDREVFAILNLKNNGQVLNMNICSVGTINASLVAPREVMKSCILSNASCFLALHVHPSGNPEPSEEDKEVTEKLLRCGDLMEIRMLDHIIIGSGTGEMFSFKSNGLMDRIRDRSDMEINER